MGRKPGAPHTAYPRGKRVRIVLRDNSVVIGKFQTETDLTIFLQDGQKVPRKKIRAMGVLKAGELRVGETDSS